jgi:HK97 family phage portal protein
MSLLNKLGNRETRDYSGGTFTDPYALPNYLVPTPAQAAYLDGGIPITTQAALRHPAVFACIRLIADVIASLPIDAHDPNGIEITPLPSKLEKPSAYAWMSEWMWQVVASLLTNGNAIGLYGAFDWRAFPLQVDLINPDTAHIEKNGETGLKQFRIGQKILTEDQVWHLPGPQLPGELAGLSPLHYAARTICMGLEAEKFGRDFYTNGITPTATLETDQQVNADQALEIKQRVKDSMASRDMVVLGAGMRLNPWQMTAQESQVIESLTANAVAVCQIFGVPPEMIGIAHPGKQSLTYANREQRAQDFLNNAINPWLVRIERSLSAWFPRGTYVKFNTGGLLRSDLLTRYQAYELGIQNNFVLPSEARALEDMPPVSGIDDKPLPAQSPPQQQGSNNDKQSG